jgi:hypothetical protein
MKILMRTPGKTSRAFVQIKPGASKNLRDGMKNNCSERFLISCDFTMDEYPFRRKRYTINRKQSLTNEKGKSLDALIDTFPAFLTFWNQVRRKSLDDRMELWASEYMSAWPELLAKQLDDYASQNLDWRQVAREKVFPHLASRLPAMQAAHKNLLEACGPIHARAQKVLGFDDPMTFVIHVGIGCGAGWATTFGGSPAVLFGLENLAECGWEDPETIRGLVAHELGHLVHFAWRAQGGKPTGSGPWWQLYEEGFAQECESRILDTDAVHQAGSGEEQDWLSWCRENKSWLAGEFLRRVDAGQPVKDFFGSWFEIQGHSETGYFLGQELIRELEKRSSLQEVALLEDLEAAARPVLERMARRVAEKGDPDDHD